MNIPTPSQLINCNDLESCFQDLYNFFFGILVALAFVYFLWGAIEYLLSGSTFASKEAGKKKMINSIIALIITLILPVIVNWINPEIFKQHELTPPSGSIPGKLA